MIWTVIEWIAILAECFMVARLMIRYFGFRSPEKRLLKWGVLVGILVCIDALGSFLIQNEIILVAGFVLTNFIYAAILLRGNFFDTIIPEITHIGKIRFQIKCTSGQVKILPDT